MMYDYPWESTWSKPCYGVTHRCGYGMQVTIEEYENFAELVILDTRSKTVFTEPECQKTFFTKDGGLEAAKKWADEWIAKWPIPERIE